MPTLGSSGYIRDEDAARAAVVLCWLARDTSILAGRANAALSIIG